MQDKELFRVNSLLLFLAGMAILVSVIAIGGLIPNANSNNIFLTTLSLSVAVTVSFLPFTAEFSMPSWAKATGAAAVYAISMYMNFNFVEKEREGKIQTLQQEVRRQSAQIETINQELSSRQSRIDDLIAAERTAGQTSETLSKQCNDILLSASRASNLINFNLSEASRFASGAISNTQDPRGCTSAAARSQASIVTAQQKNKELLTVLQQSIGQ